MIRFTLLLFVPVFFSSVYIYTCIPSHSPAEQVVFSQSFSWSSFLMEVDAFTYYTLSWQCLVAPSAILNSISFFHCRVLVLYSCTIQLVYERLIHHSSSIFIASFNKNANLFVYIIMQTTELKVEMVSINEKRLRKCLSKLKGTSLAKHKKNHRKQTQNQHQSNIARKDNEISVL